MTERHVIFVAEVTSEATTKFINLLLQHGVAGTTRLVLAMNSPGGSVVSGIAIYNALMSVPYEVVTHNIANVDSIANVIFLAGKERYACEASTFMFHGIGFNGNGNERLEEKNLRQKLDVVTSGHGRASKIIASRSQLSEKAGRNLFKEQSTKDVAWAKKTGIIHEIRPYIMGKVADTSLFT